MKAQGAIESSSRTTAGTLVGQGATEYLVLLAVVLIVALVSVALLGFFPGMASDAQITQSKAYWQSASPIQIIESDARAYTAMSDYTSLYIRLRNAGAYPIRITKVMADNNQSISQVWISGAWYNISDYFYMAPGEEKYFGWQSGWPSLPDSRAIAIYSSIGASSANYLHAAQSNCQNSTSLPGTLSVSGFGFEYVEYIDGQQVTKRQVGKPLVIKCSGPPI